MGKVVKSVLSIAAIAVQFVPGIGTIAGLAISAALSIGASLISTKPKSPRNSPEAYDRLRASIDPRVPRKTVVGQTAMATDIRDEEFTDDQTYFHRFIVCASHEVESIDEIWFDDKRVWTDAGGVEGEAVGYLAVTARLRGSAANAINISSRMGSSRRFTGLAYVHLRYKLTGNSKKAESPYAQGITTRITIRGKGAKIYDPRLDDTVPGGSGSHRADTQSTWTWDADHCRNPALALLFYLLGHKINGTRAVGKGIPPERIDLESFAIAANICDEPVATEAGGSEPRYRCDGVWSEGDSPTTVIEMLKATMNADLDDVGGKLRLTVFHNDLADVVTDFTDDDVLDAFEWQHVAPLDQTFNVVRGTYTDPRDDSLYQQIDYPQQEEASPDGIDRIETFNLPMVQSPDQAQRLADLRLRRQRFSGVFSANFQATAWKVQKNSVVRLSFAQTGFEEKLFRVAAMEIRQDGIVPMTLREEDASIYAGGALAPAIAVVPSTPYNPTLNPFLQAVNDANSGIVGTTSAIIEAETSGDVADGELPAIYTYSFENDGVAISSGVTWTATVTEGTASVSISTAGVLTLSSLTSNTASIRVRATYNGVAKPPITLSVRKRIASVDINTGTGGTSATDNSFDSFSGTTFVAVSDELSVNTGSVGEVDLTAPLNLRVGSGSGAGAFGVSLRWQQDVGGTWTDVGSEVATGDPGTAACMVDGDGVIVSGHLSAAETITGLSTSTAYTFRLTAKADAVDGVTRYLTGTASASGS